MRPTTKNRAFLSAYMKGFNAGAGGAKRSSCPYDDHRGNYHEMVTFSRAFIRYWMEGYDDATRAASKPIDRRTIRRRKK